MTWGPWGSWGPPPRPGGAGGSSAGSANDINTCIPYANICPYLLFFCNVYFFLFCQLGMNFNNYLMSYYRLFVITNVLLLLLLLMLSRLKDHICVGCRRRSVCRPACGHPTSVVNKVQRSVLSTSCDDRTRLRASFFIAMAIFLLLLLGYLTAAATTTTTTTATTAVTTTSPYYRIYTVFGKKTLIFSCITLRKSNQFKWKFQTK